MSLAYEGNTDLAFDTSLLRISGRKYGQIAVELRNMSSKLDDCILRLRDSGWTTPAGSAFYKMTEANWKENIEKYAALLDTLNNILEQAAEQYDDLVINHIERTKI